MSNLYIARGVTRLSVALLIAAISVIVYSCRKELIKSAQPDASIVSNDADVQAARDWYVAAYPPVTDDIKTQSIESVKQNKMTAPPTSKPFYRLYTILN